MDKQYILIQKGQWPFLYYVGGNTGTTAVIAEAKKYNTEEIRNVIFDKYYNGLQPHLLLWDNDNGFFISAYAQYPVTAQEINKIAI